MDFFQKQDDARRRTRRLVMLFALSVLSIILLLYILFGFLSGWKGGLLNLSLLAMTAGGAGFVISLGSGFKLLQLSAGGSVVAKDLGGTPLDPDTPHPDERRLLNIVEEMALASGVPVPQVWLLEEDGINAFAAGHTPADAVIGVTRGCMRTLTRDELQGVIAHEFSHILNGDMRLNLRLNLRLIGVVHGLLIVAILGRILLEFTARGGGGGSRNSEGKDPRQMLMLAGLGTLAAGYLGVFFGNLIKSAISRQREFLADASAVQFTRNPDGIGGALLKIGGSSYGSKIQNPRVEEASHMMFSSAIHSRFSQMLATHPPLDQRVKAILPHWDGSWPEVVLPEIRAERKSRRGTRNEEREEAGFSAFYSDAEIRGQGNRPPPVSAAAAVFPQFEKPATIPDTSAAAAFAMDRIGQVNGQDLAAARLLLGNIPEELLGLLRDPQGAQATVLAVLLASGGGPRTAEVALLQARTDAQTLETLRHTAAALHGWPSARLIALLELSLPALRRLTPAEYQRFRHLLTDMVHADNQTDVFEFMLQKMMRRHLDLFFQKPAPPSIRHRSLSGLRTELQDVLCSFAALSDTRNPAAGASALQAAGAFLLSQGVSIPLEARPVSLESLDKALDAFDQATPLLKKQLLHACAAAVMADGQTDPEEAELLRAVADTLGCPLPPFAVNG